MENGEPTALPDILLEIQRACRIPTTIDKKSVQIYNLRETMLEAGGTAFGTLSTNKFCAALSTTYKRIHWSTEKFETLIRAYGCGYRSNIRASPGAPYETSAALLASDSARLPTEIAWKDFVLDVESASEAVNFGHSEQRREWEARVPSPTLHGETAWKGGRISPHRLPPHHLG